MLIGGLRPDVLWGGAGDDTFRFGSARDAGRGTQRDEIADFRHQRDVIDISGMDGNIGRSGNQPFRFVGRENLSGEAGEVNYQSGVIRGDHDGDGKADFAIELDGAPRLSEIDFIL